MEQMDFSKQRLARLEERDRQVLNTEMRPARMLSLMLSIVSIVWLFVFLLLFKLVWVAIVGAALISIGNWFLERRANYEIKKDLAEDEKIITVRKIEKLEVNPKTGTFVGGPFSASDRSAHNLYQAGYFVMIGNLWYPVRKEEFEAMQGAEVCEFHTAQHSHTYLDCTAIRD